ncbi:MAG: hypothetical protein GKR77_03735 [Legionellales bacterium]|nr:hypothetical protein [Legionellales bacterium]
MERFRRLSQSTPTSLTTQRLLARTHDADEITRNCLQLLFAQDKDFVIQGKIAESESPQNLITCLEQDHFNSINFNTLNREENFVQTTYPQPISKGRKTALLLSRCIFYYFIHHGKSIKELYQFTCQMITTERDKQKEAFRKNNIAASLIALTLSYVHTYSITYELPYLLTAADTFAKLVFSHFLDSFKASNQTSHNPIEREIKNFNFFYTTLVLNLEKGSPSYDFFLNREEYFRIEAHTLLASLPAESHSELLIVDQLDIPKESWNQLREDQVRQIASKAFAPDSNPPNDEDKSDDSLLTASIDAAWERLQTEKQLILNKLESLINPPPASPSKRRSFLARLSISSGQASNVTLKALIEAFRTPNSKSMSALQILKRTRPNVSESSSSPSKEFEFANLSIQHVSALIQLAARVSLVDMVSEYEPQRNCLKLLFGTEFYVDGQSVFKCLTQRNFLSNINFEALSRRIDYTGWETDELFSKIILRYLDHHQFSLDEIKKFIEGLIQYAAQEKSPFRQSCLIDQLICICLTYIQQFYSTPEQQISFLAHILQKFIELFYKDQAYIEEQAFHPIYERFVAPALSRPSDAYKSSLLTHVNTSLEPDASLTDPSEHPVLQDAHSSNVQAYQPLDLSPLDLDLHTRFNSPKWCSSPKETASSSFLEQKVSIVPEETSPSNISTTIQKAWGTLINQKENMLTEVTALISIVTKEILETSSRWKDTANVELINKREALKKLEELLENSWQEHHTNYTLTAVEILKNFRVTAPDFFAYIGYPESDYIQKILAAIQQKKATSPKKITHRRARTLSTFFGISRAPTESSSPSEESSSSNSSSETTATRPRSVTQFTLTPPHSS